MVPNFESKFSDNARAMKASEIRELLKLTNKPGMISLAGGLPDPTTFPKEIIKKLVTDAVDNNHVSSLQYGRTEGVPALRKIISEKFHGGKVNPEHILISSGSQQALDTIGKVFIDPGDRIITSAPTYLGAITAFRAYRVKFETVPADDYGMNVDILEDRLKSIYSRGEVVKFIYIIPNFHNPNGSTMPMERRKKLVNLAKEFNIIIVEDDPYGQLRYTGEPKPKIHDLLPEQTIYMSTFSKIIVPALRLGWNVIPKSIYSKMIICKQSLDLCTSPLNQYIALGFLKNGHLEPHIENIKKNYGHKLKVMLESLEKYFPKSAHWTKPEGGMFLWVTLDPRIDTRVMFPRALDKNVAYVLGGAFQPNGGDENTMRLNFSFCSPDIIREGVKRLAEVIKDEMELVESVTDKEPEPDYV